MEYDGTIYASIRDFLGEAYNHFGFTKKTQRELDFLQEKLDLRAGARILDVGCGTGRHSLELARRSYRAMGVDISRAMVEVAHRQPQEESLAAEFHVADARALHFEAEFDAATCLCEGAFGLAGNEAGHRDILAGVHRALKPEAPFVLTAVNALSAVRALEIDDAGQLLPTGGPGNHTTIEFDPYTTTSRQRITVHNPDGQTRDVEIFTTAFTYWELSWLLRDAGFDVEAGSRSYSREPIGLDHSELMVIARRRQEGPREHSA